MKVKTAVISEELEELHQTNGPKPEIRSLLSPYLAWSYCWNRRKHLGLKSAVFVVVASVLWGAADTRNLVGEFYGVNVFVAYLLLRVLKGSALVFCDMPPCTLLDIYQHLGGNLLLPSSGYKKMETGSSETFYTRIHGVASQKDILYNQSREGPKFCSRVNSRGTFLFN